MRKFLPSVLLLLISSPLINAQSVDRQSMHLIGPVHTVRDEAAKLENHSGQPSEGPRVLMRSFTFDKQGNSTEEMGTAADGSRWKFGWERTYDQEGKEIKRAHYNAEGALTSLGLYTYDGSGKKIKMTRYNPDGSVSFYQEYLYDEKGRRKEEYDRNGDGSPRAHLVYMYDDRGQQVERVHYNPDETLSARLIFTYDEQGNLTSFSESPKPGIFTVCETSKYDARGNLIERVATAVGSRVKELYDGYEFDSFGNWVKRNMAREVINDGNKQVEKEITYRTITYY